MAIGRAIVRDADLFLFDEPLSNLDAKLRDGMQEEIKRLHRELGKTFIYVTHDQIEATTVAERIMLLWDGVIEQPGTPLSLFERPEYFHPAEQGGNSIDAAFDVEQPTGSRTCGSFALGDAHVVAALDAHALDPSASQRLAIGAALARTSFFDAETGEAVWNGAQAKQESGNSR